jgi:hypothetical protein
MQVLEILNRYFRENASPGLLVDEESIVADQPLDHAARQQCDKAVGHVSRLLELKTATRLRPSQNVPRHQIGILDSHPIWIGVLAGPGTVATARWFWPHCLSQNFDPPQKDNSGCRQDSAKASFAIGLNILWKPLALACS